MASIQVFGHPECTDVARVLACLFEKNVAFEFIRTATYNSKGEKEIPEFIRLQDLSGKVVLKHGAETKYEDSREICKYICDKFPEQGNRKLYGPGALERASIERWLQTEAEYFDGPSSKIVFNLAFTVQADMQVLEKNEKKLAQVLDIYDKNLDQQKFLAGDHFTLADLTHMPNTHYLVKKSGERGYEIIASRKNVMAWWRRIRCWPSWTKVVQMQMQEEEYDGCCNVCL